MEAAWAAVESGDAPWAVVTCWGWSQSPVGWLRRERSALDPGGDESCVSLLLLGRGRYCLWKALGANEGPEVQPPAAAGAGAGGARVAPG